jgi:prepilin peptidase CpaA
MVFPFAMAFAAAMDLQTLTIPNSVSVVLIGAFLTAALIAGLSWQDILVHLATGSVMLLVGIFMFSMGWLGGGDAKLLAAGTFWIGFDHLAPFLFYVVMAGGLLSLIILAYRRSPAGTMLAAHLPGWAERLHTDGSGIPYGIAIAASGLIVFPSTNLFALLAA